MAYFWWIIAVFVHVNAIFALIVLCPFPTSKQWRWIVDNRVVNCFAKLIGINVWGFYLAILCPCFIVHLDSIRAYYKYSAVDFELFADRETRKDARIQLLLSQRNYYISGAAMILCILLPRVIAVRVEAGKASQYSESILKKVIKELVGVVRDVENEDSDTDREENKRNSRRNKLATSDANMLAAIQRELEKLNNREREDIGAGVRRYYENQDMNSLRTLYERIKNQQAQDRANNNQFQPNQVPPNQNRIRLAHTRFSHSNPYGSMNHHAPRSYRYDLS